jgi:hypothetical protein
LCSHHWTWNCAWDVFFYHCKLSLTVCGPAI